MISESRKNGERFVNGEHERNRNQESIFSERIVRHGEHTGKWESRKFQEL